MEDAGGIMFHNLFVRPSLHEIQFAFLPTYFLTNSCLKFFCKRSQSLAHRRFRRLNPFRANYRDVVGVFMVDHHQIHVPLWWEIATSAMDRMSWRRETTDVTVTSKPSLAQLI